MLSIARRKNPNKPDIAIFDKENNKWIIIEGDSVQYWKNPRKRTA